MAARSDYNLNPSDQLLPAGCTCSLWYLSNRVFTERTVLFAQVQQSLASALPCFSSLPSMQNSAMHTAPTLGAKLFGIWLSRAGESTPTIQRGTRRDIDPDKMSSGTFQYATVG